MYLSRSLLPTGGLVPSGAYRYGGWGIIKWLYTKRGPSVDFLFVTFNNWQNEVHMKANGLELIH